MSSWCSGFLGKRPSHSMGYHDQRNFLSAFKAAEESSVTVTERPNISRRTLTIQRNSKQDARHFFPDSLPSYQRILRKYILSTYSTWEFKRIAKSWFVSKNRNRKGEGQTEKESSLSSCTITLKRNIKKKGKYPDDRLQTFSSLSIPHPIIRNNEMGTYNLCLSVASLLASAFRRR